MRLQDFFRAAKAISKHLHSSLAGDTNSLQPCLDAAREERDLEREVPSATGRCFATTSRVSTLPAASYRVLPITSIENPALQLRAYSRGASRDMPLVLQSAVAKTCFGNANMYSHINCNHSGLH